MIRILIGRQLLRFIAAVERRERIRRQLFDGVDRCRSLLCGIELQHWTHQAQVSATW